MSIRQTLRFSTLPRRPFFIIGADKQCVTLSLVPPLAFTSGKVNKKLPEDTLFKLAGKLK